MTLIAQYPMSVVTGDLDRAARYEQATETLATVVMRLPGWDAALEEVRGHLELARGSDVQAVACFRVAAEGFRDAGSPRRGPVRRIGATPRPDNTHPNLLPFGRERSRNTRLTSSDHAQRLLAATEGGWP